MHDHDTRTPVTRPPTGLERLLATQSPAALPRVSYADGDPGGLAARSRAFAQTIALARALHPGADPERVVIVSGAMCETATARLLVEREPRECGVGWCDAAARADLRRQLVDAARARGLDPDAIERDAVAGGAP